MATSTVSFDQTRAEAFAERFTETLNGGALCLMTSIGHRTGLFDTLKDQPPLTSDELAERAGLHERYVREWLGAMTTAGVIEHDPATKRFHLPAEHAAVLTRAAGADNMAGFAQYVGILGSVEDGIVECFRNGGGVPYEKFPRFHEVMAEDSGQSVLPVLRDHILPLVPGLIERLEAGIDVADLGCGRGKALNLMASWFPQSRFTGIDLSAEALDYARAEAARLGNRNIRFIAQDLSTYDADAPEAAYDFVATFDAIHDQPKPAALLRGIARSLRPGGAYLAQDINGSCHVHNNLDHPLGTFLYTISTMHCMTVSLAQGGDGLGTMWGRETALEMMREAGFGDVKVHELPHDDQNCYYVCRVESA